MDHSTAAKQINILIQLAEADKHFAKAEREMIFQIAKTRNVPEELVSQLIRSPEPLGNLSSLTDEEQLDYLIHCIRLIFADQKVFESELIFCRNIAQKLGFQKNVVDYLVKNTSKLNDQDLHLKVFTDFRHSQA